MSPNGSFNLPLRFMLPTSVTLDPVFALLYENKGPALTHLIVNKAPLPLKNVINNGPFMEYILNKESGPKVEYKNLRPALTAMRGFLIMSPTGKQLLDFYRQLLQLQARWAIAYAEQINFEIWKTITQALYIDRCDTQLETHICQYVPDAQTKIVTCTVGNRHQFDMMILGELGRLRNKTRDASDALHTFKSSPVLWTQHGKLVASIEHCEKKLAEIRQRSAVRKREQQARVNAACVRNGANLHRQMGMGGMTPNLPHVEEEVVDWVNDAKNEYFNFQDADNYFSFSDDS
ncbi:hypothetical protein PV11_06095 [Exophiala sideris]|uniref:Uncharacterized protein n=1 Tax=Exophiala sideris TaxID=1016849 RepID=A0A0D1YML3_9EURO|nr:hypothetical protein PV11_06095 [Exophiala sideris]